MRGKMVRAGRLMDRWLDVICNSCGIIAGGTIVLMTFVTTYGVIRRYIFHTPDDTIILASCILMLGCIVFTFAEVERLKRNISVDFLSRYIPRVIRGPLLNIGGPLMGLIFLVILVWRNWVEALFALQSSEKTNTMIAIPTFPFRLLIVFGAALLCLVLIFDLVRYVISLVEKRPVKKQISEAIETS
jgi:TRAP-type C4-dicarboxylate transport system permease small subunit